MVRGVEDVGFGAENLVFAIAAHLGEREIGFEDLAAGGGDEHRLLRLESLGRNA